MSAVPQKQDSLNTIVFPEQSRLVVNYHPVLLQNSVLIMPLESRVLPNLTLVQKAVQRSLLWFVKREVENIIGYPYNQHSGINYFIAY